MGPPWMRTTIDRAISAVFLGKTPEGSRLAVVNAGIAGNRLLSDGYGVSALSRFDRDALALPGVTHIVLLEGLNDVGFPRRKAERALPCRSS